MATRECVVVAGGLAQRSSYGGHVWVFLQYLLGFRRLGFDVLFIDRLTPAMCGNGDVRASPHLRSLVDVMRRFGLADSYAVLGEGGEVVAGRSRRAILAEARRSVFLLNVMGFLDDEDILEVAPRRVFLDIDPGFGQMWYELGLADVFAGHEHFATVGTNIGRPECAVPLCGLRWITINPPVFLDEWPIQPPRNGRFVAIGAWRGPAAPIEFGGRTFGLRVHEFRKFVELPRRSRLAFEAALDIDPSDGRDIELLRENRWALRDAVAVAGDVWRYRAYVQASGAEIMIAKGMYVQTRSGWFSDRSACFLASGKPVLAQDTAFGFARSGSPGLLTFATLDEAVEGAQSIAGDYRRHAEGARALARDLFATDVVLPRFLADLGVA